MRPVNSVWFFSLTSWCNFETPHSSYATWQTFDETDILPIEFSCRMACRGMQKPCRSRAALTSILFSPFAAWQGRILLHSAAQHSVDPPLYTNLKHFGGTRAFFRRKSRHTPKINITFFSHKFDAKYFRVEQFFRKISIFWGNCKKLF